MSFIPEGISLCPVSYTGAVLTTSLMYVAILSHFYNVTHLGLGLLIKAYISNRDYRKTQHYCVRQNIYDLKALFI